MPRRETPTASVRTTTRLPPHDRRRPPRSLLQTPHRLAVIPGDGIGRGGHRRGPQGARRGDAGGREARVQPLRPRRRALPRHRRGAARTRCSTRSAGTTRSCSARWAASPATRTCRPGILERGLLLRLRFELDHYVNLRPSRIFPGVTSPLADPGEVDFVVVREGTEGPYTGNGGALRVGTPAEVATEVSVNTAFGVERVVRDAFARAAARPRRKLTLVHKTNVLVHAGAVWSRLVARGRRGVPRRHRGLPPRRRRDDLPDHRPGALRRDRHRQPVRRHHHRPRRRDHRRHRAGRQRQHQPRPHRPSMFEPVHGSAPDIAGQQKADPTAAILSVGAACSTTSASRRRPAGRGGGPRPTSPTAGAPRRTAEVGDAIAARRRLIGDARRGASRPATTPTKYGARMSALDISVTPNPTPTARRPAGARSSPTPGSGCSFTDHMVTVEWTPDAGWHDARVTAYGPLSARPGDRGAALRAGDLRGAEGLPARRRLDLDVPARGQRRADAPLGAAARAARAAGRGLPRHASTRSSRSTSAGCPTQRGRRASTCGRSCSPPRRSSACGRPST